MPAETPRSTLFQDRARKFRILADDSKGARLDYVVLAAAFEALAGQSEAVGEKPQSVDEAA